MKLWQILKDINFYADESCLDCEISGISIDSNKVKKGDLFIALKGVNADGNNFIQEAIEKGAVMSISDCQFGEKIIKVDDARKAYSLASKNFFDRACDDLIIVGVTGTNGKTTTTSLISKILEGSGIKTGLIGTEGVKFSGKKIETGFTTPDPYVLHSLFKQMKEEGAKYVIMEVSAHALALKKLEGIKFSIGVLTNITEDHLDFFKNMENYSKAKLDFFKKEKMTLGIVCSDDPYARSLMTKADVPIISYGMTYPSDTFASNVRGDFDQTYFTCTCVDDVFQEHTKEEFEVQTKLVGSYNVLNTLAAISACRALDLTKELIQVNLSCINPVEGRFNVIRCKGISIVIDYAHTPDGLEKVIKTARELTDGRLITLFGCGGNRDRLKRKIMGKIASENSDKVIVTSDNPRFENPMDIINEIKEGLNGDYEICENRAEAIKLALDQCNKGDCLIIAGKGGEKYQDIQGVKHPYNDFDVVNKYFRDQFVEIKGGKYDS